MGPNVDRTPTAALIADNGGRDRLSARHIHDEGNQAAEGKIDPFDWIARPHQHGVPFKLNHSEVTHKQIEVCWRQRS